MNRHIGTAQLAVFQCRPKTAAATWVAGVKATITWILNNSCNIRKFCLKALQMKTCSKLGFGPSKRREIPPFICRVLVVTRSSGVLDDEVLMPSYAVRKIIHVFQTVSFCLLPSQVLYHMPSLLGERGYSTDICFLSDVCQLVLWTCDHQRYYYVSTPRLMLIIWFWRGARFWKWT